MYNKILAAGILPICTKTGRMLLVRRVIEKGNDWAMLGGKYDEGDKGPKDTAKREFFEESGFDGEYKISKEPFYVNKNTHISFYTYIGLFNEEFVPCGEDYEREHADYGWFLLGEIPENLHPEIKELFAVKTQKIQEIINKFKS